MHLAIFDKEITESKDKLWNKLASATDDLSEQYITGHTKALAKLLASKM